MKITNKIITLRRISILAFSAIVGVSAVSIANQAVYAESEKQNVEVAASAENGRMVSIFDQDSKQNISVVTKAKTIREALQAANVQVNEGDVVEPGLDTELVASSYSVNVYRARPVIIEDGDKKLSVTTAYQTPKQIAKAAGIEVYDEDVVNMARTTDILSEGVGVKMSIERATEFEFVFYGKSSVVRTTQKTVGEYLQDRGIKLSENDGLSLDVNAPIQQGMKLELWKNGKQTVTEEKPVDAPVEKIENADKEVGYEEVKEAGEAGAKNVTYEIEMQNGVEVNRKEVNSVVTKEPKKRVLIVGTKAKAVGYTGGGSKDEWLAASGIPSEYWGYVDSIVSRESGWNPNATNSGTGACGLAQALPCSKVGGAGGYDPVASLQWMNSYVNGRYGGWAGAYSFWQANHWY